LLASTISMMSSGPLVEAVAAAVAVAGTAPGDALAVDGATLGDALPVEEPHPDKAHPREAAASSLSGIENPPRRDMNSDSSTLRPISGRPVP
jgi:hypothetical protein